MCSLAQCVRTPVRAMLGKTLKTKRGQASLKSRKLRVVMNIMAQRLYIRCPMSSGSDIACAMPLQPVSLEAQTATCMLSALQRTAPPLSVALVAAKLIEAAGRIWCFFVFLSDAARTNHKLVRGITEDLQKVPHAIICEQRCDGHQAHKIVEAVLAPFNLLSAMYACVHLLELAEVVSKLIAAVNLVLDKKEVKIYKLTPPKECDLTYSSKVLEYTLLHCVKKQQGLRPTILEETYLVDRGIIQAAESLQSVLNGDWTKDVLEHCCFDAQTGNLCCASEEETVERIRQRPQLGRGAWTMFIDLFSTICSRIAP